MPQGFSSLIKKFIDLTMPNKQVSRQHADVAGTTSLWDGISVSLVRFFEGPPIGKYGTFDGIVFTAYKLLAGTALIEKGGVSVSPGRGDWIMCLPGKRFQDFSGSARIISVHLQVESPTNAACWSGVPVLTVKSRTKGCAALDESVKTLRRSTLLKQIEDSGRISPQGVSADLPEALELQINLMSFFQKLTTLLEPMGMHYSAPLIRDRRVRESRQRLTSASFREGFDRTLLAKAYNLSPTQLDRLWRDELEQTPFQFWNHRRLEAACVHLQGDALSIKEIAFELGFVQLSQFSSWFRLAMKESPRGFRQRHNM